MSVRNLAGAAPIPLPTNIVICTVCAQPWAAHTAIAYREVPEDDAYDEYAVRQVPREPRLDDCIRVLKLANAGPEGPTGATGATGPMGLAGTPDPQQLQTLVLKQVAKVLQFLSDDAPPQFEAQALKIMAEHGFKVHGVRYDQDNNPLDPLPDDDDEQAGAQ